MLLFEFTVEGPPLSHQSHNRARLEEWRKAVRDAAAQRWKAAAPLTTSLRLSVSYYHEGPSIRMDNDNMVKPIQDALIGLVYADDKQITDTVVRKSNIDGAFQVRGVSMILLEAFSRGKVFLHITISEASTHTTPLQ